MAQQARLHDQLLVGRLPHSRTVFVCGPRQVGKTTACRALSARYLDWSDAADRLIILKGPEAVARHLGLERARAREVTVVLDNLHGHRNWKSFLRKFNTRYGTRVRLVVTMLDAAHSKRSRLPPNTSLVRINPWTVGECARTVPTDSPVKSPNSISDEDWSALPARKTNGSRQSSNPRSHRSASAAPTLGSARGLRPGICQGSGMADVSP